MSDLAVNEFDRQEVAASPVEKFREYLATQGKRLTQERETIVREIFAEHEHFDSDQIVARLTQPRPQQGLCKLLAALALLRLFMLEQH